MKPDCKCENCTCKNCKCNLGHERPGVCVQTLFGLNIEEREGEATLLHGDLRKKVN